VEPTPLRGSGCRLERLPGYFAGDRYAQHNPQVADGLSGLGAALESMASMGLTMKYDRVHRVLGEGNFALTMSEGQFAGQHVAFYDLFRVEDGLIAEHWDVIEPIPPREQWKNAVLVGILLMGIGNGLIMWAQKSIPSGITALLVATFPLWLTLAEALMSRGASLRLPVVSGVLVGLLGVFLIASAKGDVSFAGAGTPIAALIAVQAASICWTIGYIKAKALKDRLPLVMASGLEMTAGGLFRPWSAMRSFAKHRQRLEFSPTRVQHFGIHNDFRGLFSLATRKRRR